MERYLPELAGVKASFKSCNEWEKFALGKCLSVLLWGCLVTQIYREGLVNHSQREADSYRND